MSGYYGDFAASRTVRCRFNTVNSSGVPTSLSAGAVIVTRDGTDVTPSGGVTLTADVGSVVGRNQVVVDMSVDPATFTAGSEYSLRLSGTANVGGTSVVGIVVGEWSVANRSALTTLGATAPAGWINAASIAAAALNAKGDWLATLGATAPVGWINAASIAAAALNAKGDWLPASGYAAPPTAAAITTAILTTQMTESYNVDGVAPTLAQGIYVCMQRLLDFAISGNTITIFKLDGTTPALQLTTGQAHTSDSASRTA